MIGSKTFAEFLEITKNFFFYISYAIGYNLESSTFTYTIHQLLHVLFTIHQFQDQP